MCKTRDLRPQYVPNTSREFSLQLPLKAQASDCTLPHDNFRRLNNGRFIYHFSSAQFNAPAQGVDSGALIKQSSQDLLLVIFIHGWVTSSMFTRDSRAEGGLVLDMEFVVRFRGKDTTFKTFPDHLKDKLSESIDNMVTECIVFPQYKVSLPSVLFSYYTEVTVSRWGYRLEANWYPSFNSIQCEQSMLKQSPSIPLPGCCRCRILGMAEKARPREGGR